MLASYTWLVELSGVQEEPEAIAAALTSLGLEVEAILEKGAGLDNVVVAEVRGKSAHPKRDALTVVQIFDGEAEYDVVCGASNVPEAGGLVVLAKVGSTIGGIDIGERKMGGIVSRGMLCSEVELDIGIDGDGIVVLDAADGFKNGQGIVDALGLKDQIFEIGLTPNRPDALGHIGLAREVAIAFGKTFEWPSVKPVPQSRGKMSPEIKVSIADADRCPRYGAILLKGVSIAPSPFATRYRLHNLGLRPVSNVVDATNLVLLQYGHPIHAFDVRKIRGEEIAVRLAKKNEKMHTLDGEEREFITDDLLICDGEGPVAVAGVMGGANSEIENDTKDVLIECAYFDPRSVRRTSRRLGLHTDASHRFERGVDPNGVPRVLHAAAAIVADLAGGEVSGEANDVVAKAISSVSIEMRNETLNALLGAEIKPTVSKRVLEGIGCEIEKETSDGFTVSAPTWRPDLKREADLIEEVARVYGYDNIPTAVPRVRPGVGGDPLVDKLRRRLLDSAAGQGFLSSDLLQFCFASRFKKREC